MMKTFLTTMLCFLCLISITHGQSSQVLSDGTNFYIYGQTTNPIAIISFGQLQAAVTNITESAVTNITRTDSDLELPGAYWGNVFIHDPANRETLTLAASNTYYAVCTGSVGECSSNVTPTTNATIEIGVDGAFLIKWSSSFYGSVNTTFEGALFDHVDEIDASGAHRKTGASSDVGSMGGNAAYVATNGSSINLRFQCDAAGKTVTIRDFSISVIRLN